MVGNGDKLTCDGFCPSLNITLQDTSFSIPVFILPVEGADVILGLAWLRTLGPVMADFAIPQLTFNVGSKAITLRGEAQSTQVSPSSIHTLIAKDSVSSLHALFFHFEDTNTTPPSHIVHHHDNSINTLLSSYHHIFQNPTQLPPTSTQDHHIPASPMSDLVNVKPYRYPQYQNKIMTDLISNMLKDGIIKPSQSPYSSPVLLVRKKDGSWRFCVDYRALNAITIKDRFSIPTVEELLDELHGAAVFSKIDLTSGYHQIRVASEDTHKTAFRTVDGHYEFLVMPFGLTNAPSTFQATMNDMFRDVLRRFVLVFFDDILIYSQSVEDHYHHLHHVFETLSQHKFFAKPSKCIFVSTSIDYLGHVISANGIEADPEKLKAIQSWPTPSSTTKLCGFLGLTGYYRRFVRNYAQIATPLMDIMKLPSFRWTEQSEAVFKDLKAAMVSLVTLTLPNFTHPFEVTTDASNIAIGAVLSQADHPIAFFSKKMCPRMQAASAYVRELYAVTEAVKKWSQEPKSWSKCLYLAEYWYNTSLINMSPFQALYGYPVPDMNAYKSGNSNIPSIDHTLQELQQTRSMLKDNLKRAQQRMVTMANEHRLDKEFKVGDKVFLRLQNYRQQSVEPRSTKKLAKRFYGPFQVLERVGAVAYRLELPPDSKIHPVFHVSLLREAKGDPTPIPLPNIQELEADQLNPAQVIDHRWKLGKLQILVAWKNHNVAEATWEDYSEFRLRFPEFPLELEDELVLKGKAVDTGLPVTGPILNNMPKRISKKPAKLRD
ncbi:uncharacterized protein LOC143599774 [Bidens hawaiensis]|uniref:uncharacterized protein LOC143599774 n=1 Tax=Bidens hawaiensis TaxID=980011 RepID=UPI00404B797B